MKRLSWQRTLIGLLIIANALPYSLDVTNRMFGFGLVCAIIGLAVLAAPIPERKAFTFLDAIRVICIALCFAAFIVFYHRAPTAITIALAACGTIPLFVPWHFRSAKDVTREIDNMREKGWYER